MHKRIMAWLFLVFFITGLCFSAFAQTQEDSSIYIRSFAQNPAHADFFRENFAMEALRGGYNLTNNLGDANFILALTVMPNTIFFDDGTEEPAPSEEKQFLLRLSMTRAGDNIEIVAFSFPFTELYEMNDHNPYLLRHVMANVPFSRPDADIVRSAEVEIIREVTTEVIREIEVEVVREIEVEVIREVEVVREVPVVRYETLVMEVPVEEPDSWRNMRLYLRISADLPINYYQIRSEGLFNGTHIFDGSIDNPTRYSRLDDQILMIPGATIGLELQFLDWMSLEANFEIRFADVIDYAFVPGFGLQLKFPIKPARHFKLSPYLAGSYTWNWANHINSFPGLALGGGFQFNVRGGNRGAWFLDLNFMQSLDQVHTKNVINPELFPNPDILRWNRFVVGLSIGYKFGFIERDR
jgi:hypothetical protein